MNFISKEHYERFSKLVNEYDSGCRSESLVCFIYIMSSHEQLAESFSSIYNKTHRTVATDKLVKMDLGSGYEGLVRLALHLWNESNDCSISEAFSNSDANVGRVALEAIRFKYHILD